MVGKELTAQMATYSYVYGYGLYIWIYLIHGCPTVSRRRQLIFYLVYHSCIFRILRPSIHASYEGRFYVTSIDVTHLVSPVLKQVGRAIYDVKGVPNWVN